MNFDPYPLKFKRMLKELVWGGRKLESVFNKKLPPGVPVGESWEVVDLPGDQSIVLNGRYKESSLENLVAEYRKEIMGEKQLLDGRFPLLLKIIDAGRTLSVQVHPDEKTAARLGGRPKTEAWYIIDVEPEAFIYAGLNPGVSKDDFAGAIRKGTVENLLNRVYVKPGDFVYLPSGTIHALGAGVLLIEIQQASNTTYRVYDWGRKGLDGKPRQLHVEQALESIDFSVSGAPSVPPAGDCTEGIASEFFVFGKKRCSSGDTQAIHTGESPVILFAIEGKGTVSGETPSQKMEFEKGETLMLPAYMTSADLHAETEFEWLEISIP